VGFLQTEPSFNHSHVTEDDIVAFEAMLDYILPEIISLLSRIDPEILRHPPLCLALHSNLLDHETKTSKPLEIGFLSANETFETFSDKKSLPTSLNDLLLEEEVLGSRAVEEWQR
ncbi:hypothetical protein TNCV_2603131, partial [Trichonephila clavipes]